MGKLQIIIPCFLLALVIAVCNGNPLDIQTPEEVVEEVADDSVHQSESVTINQSVDDSHEYQVLSGEEENTSSSDVVEIGDSNESNGEAVTTNNYVSKAVPTEGKGLYNNIYTTNTGYPSSGVTVAPYTTLDKLVTVQCPGGFSDTIMVPISANTEAITMGNRMVIGDMAYCKNPGELVLFNGNKCSVRANFQGRTGGQQLDRRTCRVLKREMHAMQEEADELAENLEMGVQNVQNFANSFGQNLGYGSVNPSGIGWSNNQLGIGNPLTSNYNNLGTYNTLLGTKPFSGTNTSPLIANIPNTANSFSLPNGNMYPNGNSNPFGSYSTVGNLNQPAYTAGFSTPISSNSYSSPLLGNLNAQTSNNYNPQGLNSNYNTQPLNNNYNTQPLNNNYNTQPLNNNYNTQPLNNNYNTQPLNNILNTQGLNLNNYNTYPNGNTNGQVLNNMNTKVTNTANGEYAPINTKTGKSGNTDTPYNAPLDATNNGDSNTNKKPKTFGSCGSTQSTNGFNEPSNNIWIQ